MDWERPKERFQEASSLSVAELSFEIKGFVAAAAFDTAIQ